ncbi:hypothetical protein BU26DRAFT_298189 [Trematosphaeria pertusa]|uniref:Uncharacterized protein n=1 Tax=Trematosphaeria pertusa TaxID=390896 RepID=A0A6A6IJ60_9PLEO|nr:uncharacterized protein BU26DRAFT_298189 [Trematosphaeria pertusa]KAF2250259.1 hypothetical protein BU26DRAFT_298189 [Trematosphaeria pertusa]
MGFVFGCLLSVLRDSSSGDQKPASPLQQRHGQLHAGRQETYTYQRIDSARWLRLLDFDSQSATLDLRQRHHGSWSVPGRESGDL